jgi:hypothetical protein
MKQMKDFSEKQAAIPAPVVDGSGLFVSDPHKITETISSALASPDGVRDLEKTANEMKAPGHFSIAGGRQPT